MISDILESCTPPTPGVSTVIYAAEAHDILLIPDVDVVGGFEITDAITFKTGKKWTQIEATVDTATLRGESLGDKGFKSAITKLLFNITGIDMDKDEFYNASLGCGMVFLVKDLDNGKYRLVGNLDQRAYSAKSNYDYGQKAGDKKMYDYEFEANSKGAALWYSGPVTLVAAA